MPAVTANPSAHAHSPERAVPAAVPAHLYAWAVARIMLGGIFLWAFVDKLLGLGYATPPARAWIAGGSPTRGFLAGTKGWLATAFHAIAGHPAVDALFMLGLLAIGVALLLGVGMRVAAASGALLMLLMYLAATPGVPGTTNPLVDSHLVYAAVLTGLALAGAGRVAGFGESWRRLPIVERHRWLE